MEAYRQSEARAYFAVFDELEKKHNEYRNSPEIIEKGKNLMKDDCFEECNTSKKRPRDDCDCTDVSDLIPKQSEKMSFKRDSSRWTEYTLENVTEEQMNGEAVFKAAYDFLGGLGLVEVSEFDPECDIVREVKYKGIEAVDSNVKKPLVRTGLACRMLADIEEGEEEM